MSQAPIEIPKFTGYQKFVVGLLAFLQFTIVLDFMILSPLGAILMPALKISNAQFGIVVSAYALSAGASGLLASGFADRFDRKKLLLFFYIGFLMGTLFCALAPRYEELLAARIVTGLFGGVIGSIVLSIVTDLFPYQMRGRVLGVVQTAFAASQILGIPLGLYFSNIWGWHAPFLMIVVIGAAVGVVIFAKLQPIDSHLSLKTEKTPFKHFAAIISKPRHQLAFLFMALLSMGGFMIMPFGSKFTVGNLKIPVDQLPMIYWITGLCTIVTGPLIGRASDRFGKWRTFLFGTMMTILMVLIYTNLGPTPLWLVVAVNAFLFVGIFSRMIPAQAFLSTIPDPQNRGAFMAVSSSLQQISGGLAAMVAGLIVKDTVQGQIEHFDTLGFILTFMALVNVVILYRLYVVQPKK
jgi:predicted MFS family arabinose efflux permease